MGANLETHMKENGTGGFKIMQIKVGFISQLISLVCLECQLNTHPILGYDAKLLEDVSKIKGEVMLLNLIPISPQKILDRFEIKF